MATIPVVYTLVDDTEKVVLSITIPAGSPDEVALTTIASPASFTGGGKTATYFSIRRVQWSLQNFSVIVWSGATVDVHIGTMCSGFGNFIIPGPRPLQNVAPGHTGELKISSIDRVGPNGSGVIIIELDKRT